VSDEQGTELGFEAALARLEEIARRLEGGDVPLDDALALWAEGDALRRRCEELLAAAEGRVEQLDAGADDNRSGSL
jgi:exodeoxyribonuclease VII small subunit